MSQSPEEKESLPIACSLTRTELVSMREGLLPGLLARASGREDVPGGFRWCFDPQPDVVKQIASVIDAEHQCCRFLGFALIVEPGDSLVWLEVTGPPGTEDFLSGLQNFSSPSS